MDLTTERQDGVLSAEVSGRIDGTTATAFEQAIKTAIEETDHALILDFKNLLYISSAGLRAILLIAKNLRQRNAKFALCSMSDQIREVFEISGFDKIVSIHRSRTDALASVER